MNFVPLFGRWATLLLAIVVAVGATALSLGVDQILKSKDATSSDMTDQDGATENPWAANDPASAQSSPSDRIVIVNPDGSVRNNEIALSPNNGGGDEVIDDYSPSETSRAWTTPDSAGKNRPADRIE